jgi:hypothetical protein
MVNIVPKECLHPILSLMRSGPDVSGYCAKCWKLQFKSKEVLLWKYAMANMFKNEPNSSCPGKIVKIYRTDKYVTARCMACDYHVRGSEFKVERNSILNPRIETTKAVWRISSV